MFHVVKLAEAYDIQLKDSQLEIFYEDLIDLSDEQLAEACELYRKNPDNTFFPRPPRVLATYVRDLETVDSRAENLLEEIRLAVTRYGSYQTVPALQSLDETGKQVVRSYGGWRTLCETLNESNESSSGRRLLSLCKNAVQKEFEYKAREAKEMYKLARDQKAISHD